jgi:type I restriction enzyme, R subunit
MLTEKLYGRHQMTINQSFKFNEKYLSQIPALQLLINIGYTYLPPEEALKERLGKESNVLLENILRKKLKELNSINYKGKEYLFSEENIQSAIQKIKNVKYDGLLRTNEVVYDLLTLGTSQEQNIEGDTKSFNMYYINWKDWDKNDFHVTTEFSVQRSRRMETARPDIVLFVNGIPLAVIECKAPITEIEEAISQSIRNQTDDYIPRLFSYAQLVMGINKNQATYATTGTASKFWGIWKEMEDKDEVVEECVNKVLPYKEREKLFSGEYKTAQFYFDRQKDEGYRLITEQDKTLYSLCRPERLLELVFNFTIFDGGIKKIARYQQYFVVKSTVKRLKQYDSEGRRKGGIIWHTQGSGKSLTMVMLARNLAFDPDIINPRIVLVTDRDDLDKQLGNTFAACGLDASRATSGRNLMDLVKEGNASIITTLVHKFDKALNAKSYIEQSSDVFMLVDESHRTQYKNLAARMRQMFPNASYLGFTGTPLLKKKERNSFLKFGGLIEPHYSIKQAVEDGAVVPLLYEGRHVTMEQNKSAIDLWFERHTSGLTDEQRADLKKKYARAEMLNKADQVIYMRAFDICEHYRANWQGTGFKAQLVAPNRESALKYKEYLDELGIVSSDIVMSPPDTREGYTEIDDEPSDDVGKFWQKMMKRYGNEDEYTKQLINQFKFGDDPEILIVIDKLLTGFDAPKNTVLYLCRMLREHTLLQAIARVNRLYEGKEFGYIIDYASVLGELDKALTMYDALEGYAEEDITGILRSVNSEIQKLPQQHSDLWELFKEIPNKLDEEAFEVYLRDEERRADFYERLTAYSKTLQLALSTEAFIMKIDAKKLNEYKSDLRRFQKLRASVKLRYAESINYKEYEPKIKKLLDTHIQANEVIQLNKPVNIFDDDLFEQVKEEQGVNNKASRADSIAHAMKRIVTEKMDEDPAFYSKFSKLIQQAIDDFFAKRLSDLEYLKKIIDIRNRFVNKERDDLPSSLYGKEDASAYYGILLEIFSSDEVKEKEQLFAEIALKIVDIFQANWKVGFWDDEDIVKQTINDIDDYLYDEIKGKNRIDITIEQMDEIIEKVMQIAKHRSKVNA